MDQAHQLDTALCAIVAGYFTVSRVLADNRSEKGARGRRLVWLVGVDLFAGIGMGAVMPWAVELLNWERAAAFLLAAGAGYQGYTGTMKLLTTFIKDSLLKGKTHELSDAHAVEPDDAAGPGPLGRDSGPGGLVRPPED